jgi:F-box and WD-40 domain protein CDC4
MSRPTPIAHQPHQPQTTSRSVCRRKRSTSPPPSIAEAAEIASLHRRNKKLRLTAQDFKNSGLGLTGSNFTPEEADEQVPTSPDTDAGESRALKKPVCMRRVNRESFLEQVRNPQLAPARQLDESRAGPPDSRRTAGLGQISSGEHFLSTPVTDNLGIAATPPIADTDLEPVGPFASTDIPFAQRPTPLNTLVAQDASLPSPSLSPVTAAANLALQNNNATSFLGDDDDLDDSPEVSSLDISQDVTNEFPLPPWPRQINLPGPNTDSTMNAQLPTPPTVMDMPTIINSFDQLPDQMKTYVMYQLLRRCPKQTLHFVADVVNPALKCDFIAMLPTELSLNIISYLDAQSMCSAARVSRKWRETIDTDEGSWKRLLDNDDHILPDDELERAIEEGWGWQYPHDRESYERDLRAAMPTTPASSGSVAFSPIADTEAPVAGAVTRLSISRLKRKAHSKHIVSSKKARKKGHSKSQIALYARPSFLQQGPFECAKLAREVLPDPSIGLASLRKMHLYKSLYQRHHSIRKSWMDPETKPKHIAFRAHQRHVVTCLQFDTDKILTGSDDTNINVYDTKTGALRNRLEGHEGGVWALQYEGNILVSGSTDRSVRVWDIEKGKCTQVFQGHTSTVRCLVILKPTKVGETSEGEPIMMPKEELIITGSRDSSLRVWKLPKPGDKSIMQTGAPANDYENPYFIRALTGHHHSVRAIAAHGDTLVSGSYDCNVRVWKISNGDVLFRLQGHTQKVYSVVLDTERNRCISGSMDNMVKVWSLETGACIFTLEGHTSLVGLLDLSHERLVSAAADSTLRIWDPENGQCKSRLCAHTGAITCFQHDGQKVISGSDRTLKMWNVQTGEFVKDLLTDLSGVWQVKFNERRCVAAVQRENMTYIEVCYPLSTLLLPKLTCI